MCAHKRLVVASLSEMAVDLFQRGVSGIDSQFVAWCAGVSQILLSLLDVGGRVFLVIGRWTNWSVFQPVWPSGVLSGPQVGVGVGVRGALRG